MKKLSWAVCLIWAAAFYFGYYANVLADGNDSRVWIKYNVGQAENAKQALTQAGAKIHYEFPKLSAFAATLPTAAIDNVSKNPSIELIEEDSKRYPLSQTVPYGIDMVQATDVWDSAPADGVIDAGAPTGAGVKVCIIDSGLYAGHEDISPVPYIDGTTTSAGNWNSDGCGHGTHVTGTITAVNNTIGVAGVSPGMIPLHIVRVFNDSCSWAYSSDLVNATNICNTAGAKVISMSLGGGSPSGTEQTNFQNLWNGGILSVAAAGNAGNTTTSYPASYASVISVAAIDRNKNVASFSQHNSEVDLAAPGVSVLSTVPWHTPTLTIGSNSYLGNSIQYAAVADVSGALSDGGLCDSGSSAWSGKVVLCQRGTISFYDKVMHVQNSGGTAAVIYNNAPGNFSGTLGAGNTSTIPAMSLSQEDGQSIVATSLGLTGEVNNTSAKPASGYEAWDGTSMATPHVSGVAALIWSAYPAKTNAEVRAALESTAEDLGDPGRDDYYGHGLVQASAALDYLRGTSTPMPPDAAPSDLLLTVISKSRIDLVWNDNSSNEDGFKIERCKGATCTNFSQIAIVGSNVENYSNTGLQKNTSYRYRVRAYNSGGDSAYTNTASAKTLSR